MGKSVCKAVKVELLGVDISKWVVSVDLQLHVGELNVCKLTAIKSSEWLTVNQDPEVWIAKPTSTWRSTTSYDLSSWVQECREITRPGVGQPTLVELHIQADPAVLRINGGFPWEAPSDAVNEPSEAVHRAVDYAHGRYYTHAAGDYQNP